MAISIAVAAAVYFTHAIGSKWRFRSEPWALPVGLAIAMPLLFVLFYHPEALYVRVFIISMAFFLILISIFLTAMIESGGLSRGLAICLVAAYLVANAWYTLNLFSYGRGAFSEVVRYMQQNTSGEVVKVGGDHPFRVPMMLSFYAPLSQIPRKIRYFDLKEWPVSGPEWLILQRSSSDDPMKDLSPHIRAGGRHYDLARASPATPLSGLDWFLSTTTRLWANRRFGRTDHPIAAHRFAIC